MARMEEFRSPGQPYCDQLFTHQSRFCIQCVGEDDERILNHVIFYLVEFRCHSHLLAKSYYLRLASLF